LKGQLAASAGGTDGLLFKNNLLDIDYAVVSLEDKRLTHAINPVSKNYIL